MGSLSAGGYTTCMRGRLCAAIVPVGMCKCSPGWQPVCSMYASGHLRETAAWAVWCSMYASGMFCTKRQVVSTLCSTSASERFAGDCSWALTARGTHRHADICRI